MRIAVAIPCMASHIQYLHICLASIAAQTVLPDLVVVSISSVLPRDNESIAELRACALPFPLEIRTTAEKQCPGANRNRAGAEIRRLRPDIQILSFFDADDRMVPQRLEYIQRAAAEGADVIVHDYRVAEKEGDVEVEEEGDMEAALAPRIVWNTQNVIYDPNTHVYDRTSHDLLGVHMKYYKVAFQDPSGGYLPIHAGHCSIRASILDNYQYPLNMFGIEDNMFLSSLCRSGEDYTFAVICAKLSLYDQHASEKDRRATLVRLYGGLGNQLFQYAAGRAGAAATSSTLYCDRPDPHSHSSRDYRIYMKALNVETLSADTMPTVRCGQSHSFGAFSPTSFSAPLFMDGYFQYLPAIRDILPTICKELRTSFQEFRDTAKEAFQITDPARTAFIHCRRGDYVTYEHCGHWLQGAPYYTEALAEIRKQAPQVTRMLLLSDDPAWCAAQPYFKDTLGLEILDSSDELVTLGVMSLCEGGAIIANSTFSWWGACMGAHLAGAPVIYPRRWLGPHRPSLFFETWTAAGPPPT